MRETEVTDLRALAEVFSRLGLAEGGGVPGSVAEESQHLRHEQVVVLEDAAAAAFGVAITTAELGSTAGVLAMFFVVAYLGLGLPPVLLTAATHLMSSRSALIIFSAVILALSVIAARLQAAALRR